MDEGQLPQLTHAALWLVMVALTFGMVMHVIFKLQDLEKRGEPIELKKYLFQYKWTTVSVVISSYALVWIIWATEGVGAIAAFLIGIACNSTGDRLRTMAESKK